MVQLISKYIAYQWRKSMEIEGQDQRLFKIFQPQSIQRFLGFYLLPKIVWQGMFGQFGSAQFYNKFFSYRLQFGIQQLTYLTTTFDIDYINSSEKAKSSKLMTANFKNKPTVVLFSSTMFPSNSYSRKNSKHQPQQIIDLKAEELAQIKSQKLLNCKILFKKISIKSRKFCLWFVHLQLLSINNFKNFYLLYYFNEKILFLTSNNCFQNYSFNNHLKIIGKKQQQTEQRDYQHNYTKTIIQSKVKQKSKAPLVRFVHHTAIISADCGPKSYFFFQKLKKVTFLTWKYRYVIYAQVKRMKLPSCLPQLSLQLASCQNRHSYWKQLIYQYGGTSASLLLR